MVNKTLIFGFFYIACLLVLVISIIQLGIKEGLENEINIKYYAISLRSPTRLTNINNQNTKLNKQLKSHDNLQIEIVDAIKGSTLDINSLQSQGVLSNDFMLDPNEVIRNNQIGCYLSHEKVYNLIKGKDDKSGYSVIFEDDFEISDNFVTVLYNVLDYLIKNKIQFDFLYLGNSSENYGQRIHDDIFSVDYKNNLYGCYGYLIRNSSVDKIIELTKKIDRPIDNEIYEEGKNGNFKILVIHPNIVFPGSLPSELRNTIKETFFT
jgi:GR25 family glycosyltransferase involved in LPS biosynthesis